MRLAFGLGGLQPSGGKETRQILGQGSENASPTSETEAVPGLISTTGQPSSLLVGFQFAVTDLGLYNPSQPCRFPPARN
jgi:hypothetical protein